MSREGRASVMALFQDTGRYIAVLYAAEEQCLYLLDRNGGADGLRLGQTSIPDLTLVIEARGGNAANSVSDGARTRNTPIVHVTTAVAGGHKPSTPQKEPCSELF